MSAAFRVRRLGYALGAEITGVDLTRPLPVETVAELRAAWLEHIVLCFPEQHLEAAELETFASSFGPLDDNRRSPRDRMPGSTNVMLLSNKPVTVNGKSAGGAANGQQWHSDLQFTDRPASGSFLVSKEIPDAGGDTWFSSMYAAYDALSPKMQALLEDLQAVHDLTMAPSFQRSSPEEQARGRSLNPPVVHPVVRVHPETGRKSLFVGPRVRNFTGMTEEESKPILDFLSSHAVRYEFTYAHRWSLGDLLVWDNRCAMHLAVPNYDGRQLRRMLRCALLGEKSGSYLPA